MVSDATPSGVVPSIPPPALILGAGGVVPFAAFTFTGWLAPQSFAAWTQHALVTYAMIILAFAGALHWGFTMKTPTMTERERWTWMGWSVVSALAAWSAGMLPFRIAVAVLVATFVVHLALDHRFAKLSGFPAWYLRLRRGLTAVVVAALLPAALN
jgi:uncharacterized membrane protein